MFEPGAAAGKLPVQERSPLSLDDGTPLRQPAQEPVSFPHSSAVPRLKPTIHSVSHVPGAVPNLHDDRHTSGTSSNPERWFEDLNENIGKTCLSLGNSQFSPLCREWK